MDCRDVARYAELSLDGEIDACERAELEHHLQACPKCRFHVAGQTWYQSQIQAKLQTSSDDVCSPLGLKTRITHHIRDEERKSSTWLTRALPASLGIAVMAILSWSVGSQAKALDPEEAVARHAQRMPPEVRARGSMSDVSRFIHRNFSYPMEIPQVSGPNRHIRLVGARLSHIHNRQAAYLMYDHRGARISVFAYPLKDSVKPPPHFQRRTINGRSVLIGRHKGFNVVAWERGPLFYSAVSDVDNSQLVRMVGAFK